MTQELIREVLEQSPASIRALAREAGLSHVHLLEVRDGERRLTPDVARRLSEALQRWATTCEDLAARLAEVAEQPREGNDSG